MKKSEFNERLQTIGALEDVTEIREQLIQLTEDAAADYDNLETLQTTNAALTAENEKIRAANMKLFLRLGAEDEPKEPKPAEPKASDSLEFKNLFNDKGELK